MNTQTLNYTSNIRTYAEGEFVDTLSNIETMTDADIQRIAAEQAAIAIDHTEHQDGVNVDDLDRDEIISIFADAIRARRPEVALTRDVVVFETQTGDDTAELGWRLARMALPMHSSPLAMVVNGVMVVWAGQFFTEDEVRIFAVEAAS